MTTPAPSKATRGKKTNRGKPKRVVPVPARTRTVLHQGIYISPSRVKFHLDSNGINRNIETAIKELRDAEPHGEEVLDEKTREKTGKFRTTALRPFEQLSEETRDLVNKIKIENYNNEKRLEEKLRAREERLAEDIKAGRVDPARLEAERAEAEERRAALRQERAAEVAAAAAAAAAPSSGSKRSPPIRSREPRKPTKYSDEIMLLSKSRIRFAKETPPLVAATICAALQELIAFGMHNALAQERKILLVRHLLNSGYEKLQLSCFYNYLPIFKYAKAAELTRQEREVREREERKAKKRAEVAAEKEARETERERDETLNGLQLDPLDPRERLVTGSVTEPVTITEPDHHDDEDLDTDDEDEEDDGRSFEHYVRQVCYNVMNQKIESGPKTNKVYNSIRISHEVRKFGSQLIIDFIKRLCPLLRGQIQTMEVKTVSPEVVTQITNFMFEYVGLNPENFHKLTDKKISEYRAYQKIKKAEKLERERREEEAAAKAAASDALTNDEDSKVMGKEITDDEEEDDIDDIPIVVNEVPSKKISPTVNKKQQGKVSPLSVAVQPTV